MGGNNKAEKFATTARSRTKWTDMREKGQKEAEKEGRDVER